MLLYINLPDNNPNKMMRLFALLFLSVLHFSCKEKPKAEKQDPYATIQWAIENQEILESSGFSVKDLKIDSKKIDTHK